MNEKLTTLGGQNTTVYLCKELRVTKLTSKHNSLDFSCNENYT